MLNHLFVVATLLQYTRLTGPAVPFVSTLKYSVTKLLWTAGTYPQNGKLKILNGRDIKRQGYFVDDDVD